MAALAESTGADLERRSRWLVGISKRQLRVALEVSLNDPDQYKEN